MNTPGTRRVSILDKVHENHAEFSCPYERTMPDSIINTSVLRLHSEIVVGDDVAEREP